MLVLQGDVIGFADEVKALERENAKLREQMDDAADTIEGLREELLYVQAHWELDHCPNCEARLDLMGLRDESDGLYRRYAQAVVEAEIWNEQWEAEHIENAKLRELARDLWQSCPVYTADCCVCEHNKGGECEMPSRMRELGIEPGIEVDE